MTVKKGQIGLDWSGAAITPHQLVTNGARFAMRYSAGVGNGSPNSQFKLCKPGEIQAIIAAGADFVANSEWYESRCTEGGAAGNADGREDLRFWKSRGLAKGATIYVSWDQAPSLGLYPRVEAYLRAYKAAMGGYYCPVAAGLYAGSGAIREMKRRGAASYGWQMMSTSFSDNHLPYQPSKLQVASAVATPPAGIDLWQTGNYWFSKGADENICLRTPLGSHLEALNGIAVPHPTPVPPVTIPEEDDDMRLVISDNPGVEVTLLLEGTNVWELSEADRVAYLEAGLPRESVPKASYDRFRSMANPLVHK